MKESISGVFKLDSDGTLRGELKHMESGYGARETREKIRTDGEEKYLEDLKGTHAEWTINAYENSNFENVEQDLEEVFTLELSLQATSAADKIYFQPMVAGAEKENPFKLEKREYPVDFGCPMEEMYMYTIELPEGYQIEELPEPAIFALPDKGGIFRYNVSNLGNKFSVMSLLKIDKTMFVGEEYASLKQFYDMVVAKQAEQVVLKKVN